MSFPYINFLWIFFICLKEEYFKYEQKISLLLYFKRFLYNKDDTIPKALKSEERTNEHHHF